MLGQALRTYLAGYPPGQRTKLRPKVSWFDRDLSGYPWYRDLPWLEAVEAKGIGKGGPGLREAASPRIGIRWERPGDEVRRAEVPCRWWCPDGDTLVVRSGSEPPVLAEIARAFNQGVEAREGDQAWSDATALLRRVAGGTREARAQLERELERRIARDVPAGYEATVRLVAKEAQGKAA